MERAKRPANADSFDGEADRQTHVAAGAAHLLWAALGLLLFVLVLYTRLLFTDRVLATGDILHYFYPYRDFAAEAFRSGRLPLWNPYIFLGVPFLANPQAAVFYPLHWPLSWLPVTKQIYWSAALHTWLLGMGGYLLMRRWRYGGFASFTTSLVLCGSGFYGGLVGHINQMNGAAWLPWLLLIVETVVSPEQSIVALTYKVLPWRSIARGIALFGAATALMLLAGHTQTAYINLFGVGLWTVWPLASPKTFSQRREQFLRVMPALLVYAGGVMVGLLLSGIQLLPTLELSALGLRSGGLPYSEVSSFSLKPLHLPWTLLPSYGLADLSVVFDTLGYSEFVAYVGLAGLALALYGAWSARVVRDRAWTAGVLFALLGLFLAAGRWNPIYYLLYKLIPGFDLFRAPARWMMLYTLGMAVLAGVGIERLRSKIKERRAKITPRSSKFISLRSLTFASLVLIVAIDLLAASLALPHAQPTAPQAVTDLRTAPAHLLTDPGRMLHPAAAGRFLSMSTTTFDPGDMEDYRRIFMEGDSPQLDERTFEQLIIALKSQEILAPNLPLLLRVPAVDGFDGGVLPLDRYIRFLTLFIDPDELVPDGRLREQVRSVPSSDLLGLLNAKYLITDKVRDLWFDGVYYDRQIGARLDAEGQTSVDVDAPLPFEATHVDLIGYVDGQNDGDVENRVVAEIEVVAEDGTIESLALTAGGRPGSHFADGILDSAMAEAAGATVALRDVEGGRQEYRARLALSRPRIPRRLIVRHSDAPVEVTIQAMTLYDARTGMFEGLLPSDRGRFERVHSGDVKIYENHDVDPRAYLVNQWVSADGPEKALDLLRNGAVKLGRQAVVEGAPPSTTAPATTAPATNKGENVGHVGTVEIIAYAPERIELHVDALAPALLVLSDSYYPGWRATVGGIETPIYPTNALFRGLLISPGEHVVTFTYEPTALRQGMWLTLVGLVFSLGLFLRIWRMPAANID